jgi:hypothetical protein
VQVLLKSGDTLSLRIPTLLPELSSVKSITSLSKDHFPAVLGMDTDDSSKSGILSALYNNDLPAIAAGCECREEILKRFARQKRRQSGSARFIRPDALAGVHVSAQATMLYIKRKYPVLKGFVHSFLDIENKLGKHQQGYDHKKSMCDL